MNRVLVVVPSDALGGAELYLKEVARHYLESGMFVKLVFLKKRTTGAWDDLSRYTNASFNYSNVDSESKGIFYAMGKIISFKPYRYTYTSHVHLNGLLGFLRRVKLLKAKGCVARESTLIFKRFKGKKLLLFKLLYRLGYPKMDLVICQTGRMKEELLKNVPYIQPSKVHHFQNPINQTFIQEKSLATPELDFPKPYWITAGRLIPEKGFDLLIDAFAEVLREKNIGSLVILGEGKDRVKLEELIVSLGVSNKVHLPGFSDNPFPFFLQAEHCIVSSRVEGFPNTLHQMMVLNDKVGSTRCAGGIEDLPGVITCAANSKSELVTLINELYMSDLKGFEKVEKSKYLAKHSVKSFIDKVESILVA